MEPIDFLDVRSRVEQLKLALPDCIVVLPYNLDDASDASQLLYAGSASAILKLLHNSKEVDAAPITKEPLPMRRDHDNNLVLPILFFAATYLTENPNAIAVALNIISNYATQMMQGFPSNARVSLSVAIETTNTKTVKKIDYDGPPSGLCEVARIAESVYGKKHA